MKTEKNNIKKYQVLREVLLIERKSRKVSQKTLAARLGVKQYDISKMEYGVKKLDIIELLEICDALGVTLTDFAFRLEGRFLAHGLLSPKRKKEYLRWKAIYKAYYNLP